MPWLLLKNKLPVLVTQATISICLVAYLLSLLDWRSVSPLMANGLLYQLWTGPFILMLGLALAAERWRRILFCFDMYLSRAQAFSMYLVSTFYGVLLPGVIGGDVVRIALCKKKTGGSIHSIVGSIGIERGLGLWGVALLGTIGAVLVLFFMPDAGFFYALLISPSLAFIVPMVFLVGLFFLEKIKHIKGSSSTIHKRVEFFCRMRAGFAKLPSSLILSTLILSAAFQGAEIVIYYYFGSALGLDIPFAFCLFVIPLVYLATVLPISLGGIGVREGVLVWFLSIVGIPASDAVLLAFLVYLNRVLVAAIGGAVQGFYRFGH